MLPTQIFDCLNFYFSRRCQGASGFVETIAVETIGVLNRRIAFRKGS